MPETRLRRWCDRFVEFLTLVAVVVAPLFIDPHTARIYESNKAFLVRSIGTLIGVAWVVRSLERRTGGTFKRGRRLLQDNPPALVAALFAVVLVLSSLVSVFPYESWFGGYHRRHGTYTNLAAIAIFFALWGVLRDPSARQRVITAVLLASVPVSLYAVAQHYGWDPYSPSFDVTNRAISTQGNPIFLAAYLVMVLPLTLSRLLNALRRFQGDAHALFSSEATAYGLLLLMQMAAFVFSNSRGPWAGLVAGIGFFFLLFAGLRRRRRLLLTVVTALLALGVFLVLLNLPGTPLESVRNLPYLSRFSTILRTSGTGRFIMWEGVIDLIISDPARTLVGYGPETLKSVYYRHSPADLYQFDPGASVDRAHNVTFDIVVTTGMLGLAAWISLITALFHVGLRSLRLITRRRDSAYFFAFWVLGGLLGAVTPRLLEGRWRMVGVSLPLGLAAGLALFVVTAGLSQDRSGAQVLEGKQVLSLVGLLSALFGHLVEIQSGIPLVTTMTYFWTYAALIALAGGEPTDSLRKQSPRSRSSLPYGLLMGAILITVVYGFVTVRLRPNREGMVLLVLLAVTWGMGAFLFSREEEGSANWTFAFGGYTAGSLGSLLLFALVHLWIVYSPGGSKIVLVYYAFLLAFSTVAVLFLGRRKRRGAAFWRGKWRWSYPLLAIAAAALIFWANIRPVEADLLYNVGLLYKGSEEYGSSVRWYRRAIHADPHQDRYYLWLAIDSANQMERTEDSRQRAELFQQARQALQEAMRIDPYEPDHPTTLARVYASWAREASTLEERARRLERALQYYQQVQEMSPSIHGREIEADVQNTYIRLGTIYEGIGDLQQAAAAYEAARNLIPGSYVPHKNLASLYRRLGRTEEALTEAQRAWDLAPASERDEVAELLDALRK